MDENKPRISISVRNIVEFILRRGDINSAALSPRSDLQEGSRTHRRIQRAEEKKGFYRSEVRMSHTVDMGDLLLTVQGIADGIIETEEGVTIDEIKSTSVALEAIDENFNFLHKAQACFYAYFYCVDNGIDRITVRLSYSHIKTKEIKYFTYPMIRAELEELFLDVAQKYAKWARLSLETERRARETSSALTFPFAAYRQGQRDLSASVYRAIRDRQILFAQAPTGLGKTMSTLFASVKAYGEGLCSIIFYLTAKNLTRSVAQDAMALMSAKGLGMKAVTITSKEKICRYKKNCTPEKCPYAGGHYDRINDALYDILTSKDLVTTDDVTAYAEKHKVCPFELSLDVSLFSHVIICDCNYAFDPRARLRRFFDDDKSPGAVLLCDEAHNLVERGREMFSAAISKRSVLDAVKVLKTVAPKCVKHLKKINNALIEERRKYAEATEDLFDTEDFILCTADQRKTAEEIYKQAYGFTDTFSAFLAEEGHDEEKSAAAQLFFDLNAYISVYEQLDENYEVYTTDGNDLILKLFCVNPAPFIEKICDMCLCTVFFSATLLPQQYYMKMLSTHPDDCTCVRFRSPFPKKNLLLAVCPSVSTRRKDRSTSLDDVCRIIAASTAQTGNYFIFFPSFSYMNSVCKNFSEKYADSRREIIVQSPSMDEAEREAFLEKFTESPDRPLVAFAVTGGVFAEGIDLVGTRLSGVVIVGVGLPKICGERDLIRDFYEKTDSQGYLCAYAYPGFNRVMQAAGRVIRTETDRGFVVLADDRFVKRSYTDMFPPEWRERTVFRNTEALKTKISEFFKEN